MADTPRLFETATVFDYDQQYHVAAQVNDVGIGPIQIPDGDYTLELHELNVVTNLNSMARYFGGTDVWQRAMMNAFAAWLYDTTQVSESKAPQLHLDLPGQMFAKALEDYIIKTAQYIPGVSERYASSTGTTNRLAGSTISFALIPADMEVNMDDVIFPTVPEIAAATMYFGITKTTDVATSYDYYAANVAVVPRSQLIGISRSAIGHPRSVVDQRYHSVQKVLIEPSRDAEKNFKRSYYEQIYLYSNPNIGRNFLLRSWISPVGADAVRSAIYLLNDYPSREEMMDITGTIRLPRESGVDDVIARDSIIDPRFGSSERDLMYELLRYKQQVFSSQVRHMLIGSSARTVPASRRARLAEGVSRLRNVVRE